MHERLGGPARRERREGRAVRPKHRERVDFAERFEQLQAVAVLLSAAVTPAQVAAEAATAGAALAGACGCAVGILSGEIVAVVACRGTLGSAAALPPSQPLSAALPLATAVRERVPVFVAGAGLEGALAALPLVVGAGADADVVGAVAIAFSAPQELDEDEQAFLQAFARECAQSLERARLYEAERVARLDAQRAHEATRRAVDTRDRLVGIVGHDLRTPLAAIRMSIAVLFQRGGLSEDQVRTLARIAASAVRMTRIIRDLLDFSRVSASGCIPVELRTADVTRVVRRAIAELQAIHPDREILVAACASAVARVDPERLAQVVSNLAANALQHGAPGASVRVGVEQGSGGVSVTVHNEGPAIACDPETLFEPFRRGPNAADAGSAGLGLYIVREVLRAHGGSVEVRSTDADGTTFTIRLPPCDVATTGRPAPER